MSFKKIFFILTSLLFLPLLTSAAHREIGLWGNGGLVVYDQGKLVVIELHGNPQPYFGKDMDPHLREQVRHSPAAQLLKLNPELLTRKLTDLNKVRKNLGQHVLTILDNHVILLDPRPLQVPFAPYQVDVAAVRTSRVITFSEAFFDYMDPEQKIALFLHEGIYSLVRLDCSGQECMQSAFKARPIVASLFKPDLEHNTALRSAINSDLAIPPQTDLSDDAKLRFFSGSADSRVEMKEVHAQNFCSALNFSDASSLEVGIELEQTLEQPFILSYKLDSPFLSADKKILNQHYDLSANFISIKNLRTPSGAFTVEAKNCESLVQRALKGLFAPRVLRTSDLGAYQKEFGIANEL